MKIPKAVEILELNLKKASSQMPPDCRLALSLGIEALRAIALWRKERGDNSLESLPGETSDDVSP